MKLSLAPLLAFLAEIGHPHKSLPPLIHVAGTNGKGSTIAMLRAIYQAQGYKLHVMTSPHLYEITERLILTNQEVTQDLLWNTLKKYENLAKKYHLSWYEFLIGISFKLASEKPAHAVLVEVGLGGEFDATNVIETPALCVITPISLDHHDFLGSNLREIAKAKAGIIKKNCPCLSAQQRPDVEKVLRKIAQTKGSSFQIAPFDQQTTPHTNLQGEHQLDNAQLSVEAVQILQPLLPVTRENIKIGLQTVHWPGRLECLGERNGVTLWFDVAHNPASSQVVQKFFLKRPGCKVLLFALLKNKEAVETLKPLVDPFDDLFFFTPEDSKRYHSPETLAQITQELGGNAKVWNTFQEAAQEALRLKPHDLLVAGSHYFSKEVRGI